MTAAHEGGLLQLPGSFKCGVGSGGRVRADAVNPSIVQSSGRVRGWALSMRMKTGRFRVHVRVQQPRVCRVLQEPGGYPQSASFTWLLRTA